ncbi:MAG: secondary thiamine-phosphate synthase enzyme YjbQ [Gemmatimonadales bacterium]|jgi:secondary thiamine-phosphate synthase enzyme
MQTLEIQTARRNQLVDITRQVRDAVRKSGVSEGVVHLWSFHTTCGLTVNEGADPAVAQDIAWKLAELVPEDESSYRHAEGNSDSHVKTSLVNPGAALLVSGGDLVLGTWQAIFLCEFDGPRPRKVGLQVVPAAG